MLHSVHTYIALISKIQLNRSGVKGGRGRGERGKSTSSRGAFRNQESVCVSASVVTVWLAVLAQYAVHNIPFHHQTMVPERQKIATSEHAHTVVG